MARPEWIETLRARFLADEASVFLVEVEPGVDAVGELVAFLSQKREVVGVIGAGGLTFPEAADAARFEVVPRQVVYESRWALSS